MSRNRAAADGSPTEPATAESKATDGPTKAARTPNGNRQRGGRSGWIKRRGRAGPDLPTE